MKHLLKLLRPPGPRLGVLLSGLLAGPAAAQQLPASWPGQPLAVTACVPAAAVAGTRVVLGGQGFVGVSSVRFNGVEAPEFTVDSFTQLTATVPAGAGSGPVSVATAAGVADTAAPLLVPAEVLVLDAQTLRGTYARLTIGSTGAATLAGDVHVLGGTRVEPGGQLDLGGYVLRGGGFVLAAGGTLRLTHPAGLAASGPTGAVQTELRCFSSEASYVYCLAQPGSETGSGLPARVRGLAVAGPAGSSPGLALTNDLTVSHALRLAAPLATNGHALTLLVLPGLGPALLLGPGAVRGTLRVQPAAPAALGLAAAQP